MALLVRDGDVLRLELSFWEKIGAFHSSPHAPLSALESVTYYKSPWSMSVLRGVRAPGTGFPFVILLGTMRGRGYRDFCAIRGKRPAAVLRFSSSALSQWIFTLNQSELEISNLLRP